MDTKKLMIAAGCVMVASALGCGGNSTSRPAPESLSEGLTILNVSDDVGISGAFKKGPDVVYFETKRGAVRPDFHKATSPELGDYEIDARYLDAEGNTIALQRGGDTFIDKGWSEDLAKQEAKHKVVITPAKLELAGLAAAAVAARSFPEAVSHHTVSLSDLAVSAKMPMVDVKTGELPKEIGYGDVWVGQASYEIHYKSIACVAWVCAGHHSAVRVRASSGAIIDACQHGTCAGGMSKITCYGSGGGGYMHQEWSQSLYSNYGACLTSYSWNSGGGTHNCHDDSMMTGYGIKYGPQHTTLGVCQGLNWWKAPGQSGHPCP
jgi:hypothetical protein